MLIFSLEVSFFHVYLYNLTAILNVCVLLGFEILFLFNPAGESRMVQLCGVFSYYVFIATLMNSCGRILCSMSNYNHPHFCNRLFIGFQNRMKRSFLDLRSHIYTHRQCCRCLSVLHFLQIFLVMIFDKLFKTHEHS